MKYCLVIIIGFLFSCAEPVKPVSISEEITTIDLIQSQDTTCYNLVIRNNICYLMQDDLVKYRIESASVHDSINVCIILVGVSIVLGLIFGALIART